MTFPEKPRNNPLPELIRGLFEKVKLPSGISQGSFLDRFKIAGAKKTVVENRVDDPYTRFRNLTSKGVTSTPLQYIPSVKPVIRNAPTSSPAKASSVQQPSMAHFQQGDPFLTSHPTIAHFSPGDPILAAQPTIAHYDPKNPPPALPTSKTFPGFENPRQEPQTVPTSLPATLPATTSTQSAEPARSFFQFSRIMPAFWTITGILSLLVNVVLVVVLYQVGRELFVLKAMVGDQLLGGLYENFIYMDQAHIQTDINVTDNVPVSFILPISQDTVVVLTENTPITGATVRITTGGVAINSPANIVLPAGTNLPVHLELNVPVTTTIPIKINVPVDIPLEQTQLHKPFIGLQQVVAPFYQMMQPGLKKPQDLPICQPFSAFCSSYFK